MRLQKPKLFEETLSKYSGRGSLAIDEIEKDLNRSLPEYPGFQSEEGIGRLRQVLTAYSWTNEEVGYCQAMNIVVAALLMYMIPRQSFCASLINIDTSPNPKLSFSFRSCVTDYCLVITPRPCMVHFWINAYLNRWSKRQCLSYGSIW